MKLFLFLLLPVSLFIFYFQKEQDNRAHLIPVIFIGFFTASLFLGYKLLFSSIYHIAQASFFSNFFYFLITQNLIPVCVVYGLFFFFAKKDTLKDRLSFFFPLTAGFYSVYLPYLVLESAKPYPAFYLFVKPLLFLSMLIFVHNWLSKVTLYKPSTKQKVLNYSVLALIISTPAICESTWIIGWNPLTWFIPAAFLILIAALLIFPKSTIQD